MRKRRLKVKDYRDIKLRPRPLRLGRLRIQRVIGRQTQLLPAPPACTILWKHDAIHKPEVHNILHCRATAIVNTYRKFREVWRCAFNSLQLLDPLLPQTCMMTLKQSRKLFSSHTRWFHAFTVPVPKSVPKLSRVKMTELTCDYWQQTTRVPAYLNITQRHNRRILCSESVHRRAFR